MALSKRERQIPGKGFARGRKSFREEGFGEPRPGISRAQETRLLAAARAGDRAALERVLQGVSEPAYRFSQVFCRNNEDAEEVLQDVMAAVARNLDGFRGQSSLTTWAYAVAKHSCGRKRRRRAGQPASMESLDDPAGRLHPLALADAAADPSRSLERKELREAIRAAILSLPPVWREVVLLRDVEGLPAKQVGKTLGIGERAVKSRLHRARAALREALAPIFRAEADAPAARRCPDTVRLLSRYLEQDLDAAACARLERHVSDCPHCGAACEALRAALKGCRSWGEAPVPTQDRRRIRAAIRGVLRGPEPRRG